MLQARSHRRLKYYYDAINDIANVAAPFALALDDYHVIDSRECIDNWLSCWNINRRSCT
jgi:ATP/maltotriose-dependent transcriptional regulator MalT